MISKCDRVPKLLKLINIHLQPRGKYVDSLDNMEHPLSCNVMSCRQQLREQALVTTCRLWTIQSL